MSLSSLQLYNFRNFTELSLKLHQRCNLIVGQNGAGKTSLLEALSYLILGRSFRTHLVRKIIQFAAQKFTIFASGNLNNALFEIGLTRSLQEKKTLKVNGNLQSNHTEIIRQFPLQLLDQSSFGILIDGAKRRRQFLDWGMFHVKHPFLGYWQTYEKILQHRNMALREHARHDYITMWDDELVAAGERLHAERQFYVELLQREIVELLPDLGVNGSLLLEYHPGWNTDADFATALKRAFKNDLHLGYTTVGPQRADFSLRLPEGGVKEILSRGQQKMLAFGLQLAQGRLLNRRGRFCYFCVDDIFAELDQLNGERLLHTLAQLSDCNQLFITSLAAKLLQEQLTRLSLDFKLIQLS